MDPNPNHHVNNSIAPRHATPPNLPILLVRPTNQSNNVYSFPQFQPQPQFNPHPLFLPYPLFMPQPRLQFLPQFLPQPQFLPPLPQPQQQTPPSDELALFLAQAQPSMNCPPYDDMICAAIRDLNEPDGSTKLAISRHIHRWNVDLPPRHRSLMAYHLNTLRRRGVLTKVNKSYKIVASPPLPPPPQSVAVAADLVAPRSEVPPTSPLALLAAFASGSASGSGSQPPKANPEAPQEQQPIAVGQSSREQPELPTESANRRRGRPGRDGAVPVAPTAGATLTLPAPSRPLSVRAAGRERKRPCIGEDSGGVAIAAPAGGETVAVASRTRRGPGRPRKIVRNRPRKSATPMSIREATGTLESAYGELKRKLDVACEKAKEILDMLKAGIESNDFIAMSSQARQELEGLLPILTAEPHDVGQVQPRADEEVEAPAVEEVPPEEAAAQTEAETQGEEHGQEVVEGEQAQPQPQPQTEAEAMQGSQI